MRNQMLQLLKVTAILILFYNINVLSMELFQVNDPKKNFYIGLNFFKANQLKDAWHYFSIAAQEGCAESPAYLGIISWINNDIDAAKYYLEFGRQRKEKEALYQLGRIYDQEGNIDEAKKYYYEAINAGHARAANKLGLIFFKEKNNEKAKEFFSFGASDTNNDLDAQCNLAYLYMQTGDIDEATKWYKKASDLGSFIAEYRLGLLYLQEGNEKEAKRRFLRMVDEIQHIPSVYYLGVLNEKINLAKAKRLYSIAAGRGYKKAIDALKRLNPDENIG